MLLSQKSNMSQGFLKVESKNYLQSLIFYLSCQKFRAGSLLVSATKSLQESNSSASFIVTPSIKSAGQTAGIFSARICRDGEQSIVRCVRAFLDALRSPCICIDPTGSDRPRRKQPKRNERRKCWSGATSVANSHWKCTHNLRRHHWWTQILRSSSSLFNWINSGTHNFEQNKRTIEQKRILEVFLKSCTSLVIFLRLGADLVDESFL